ncbi:hypothetical protein Tco_0009929 [Tanacetum coccineum]
MITYLNMWKLQTLKFEKQEFEDIQALYKTLRDQGRHQRKKSRMRNKDEVSTEKRSSRKWNYEILTEKYPIIDWIEEYLDKTQPDEAKSIEEINLNVVTRSNGQQRHFSVLTSVLSIFDREDLNAVYQLVMNKYQDEMPEGFERVLWGDLMVLFNPDEQDEFWSSQHEWKIIKKKYPLKKEILVQMLNLRLESEEESTMALELIRFIKKNKELSIPEQTATGKGTSNPLMAGSLPKTIKPT